MSRTFTVYLNDKPDGFYRGFDRRPTGAELQMSYVGNIPDVDGWFYTTHDQLGQARIDLARYVRDTVGEDRELIVQPVPGP